jgi:ribosomal-protein-alanine N-acetyltransferase
LHVIQLSGEDRERVHRFLDRKLPVHQHLGWQHALNWLGCQPYLAAVEGEQLLGVMACPPNEDFNIWLRLFAARDSELLDRIWDLLWTEAVRILKENSRVSAVFTLIVEEWLLEIVERAGFQLEDQVVVLSWEGGSVPDQRKKQEYTIRPLQEEDLDQVYEIDQVSFDAVWRNSRKQLQRALQVSALATVLEFKGKIVGYQISTASTLGGHLARLAVAPELRGMGLGTALVLDVMDQFQDLGVVRITVNTQRSNQISLRLYQKLGFELEDEIYPVYRAELRDP